MAGKNQTTNAALSVQQLMSNAEAGFGRILKRARAISQLDQRVSGLLDKEFRRHCRVANVRDGCLIFACTSPGIATRLRMQSGKLLDDLHAAGLKEIESIDVKIMVERQAWPEEGN